MTILEVLSLVSGVLAIVTSSITIGLLFFKGGELSERVATMRRELDQKASIEVASTLRRDMDRFSTFERDVVRSLMPQVAVLEDARLNDKEALRPRAPSRHDLEGGR